jgi:small subunit ribosomal protein S15
VAYLTARIRTGQDAYDQNIRNKKLKQRLVELIAKRKQKLRLLRRADYKCFEYVLERLNLKYIPQPEHVHRIERKFAMKTLTFKYCQQIINTRLDDYRRILESQQLTFLEDKIKNLELIRKEQKECKVPVTISMDYIDNVKKQYADLKKKRLEEAEIQKKNEVRDDYEIKLL